MIAIDSVPSPKIETWMVDMLFGQQGQATSAVGAASTVPSVAVTSGARSAVAAGTGQAIASLPAGGAAPPVEETSGLPYLTVRQANAQVASNQALTSAQISAALYSGAGVPQGHSSDTFADVVHGFEDWADWNLKEAERPTQASGGQTSAELRALGEHLFAYAASMQKAFDRHAIAFQKLSDVPGLNDTERMVVAGPDPDSLATSCSWVGGFDEQAMKDLQSTFIDGKQASFCSYGGIMVLATWMDDSLL